MIHLFILPGDNSNNASTERAIESVPFKAETTILTHRGLSDQFTEALYYMYMYDNEYLSKELRNAFPAMLRMANIHFFSFYQRNIETEKFFLSPRLFRSDVKLKNLFPKGADFLEHENILDGFIEVL